MTTRNVQKCVTALALLAAAWAPTAFAKPPKAAAAKAADPAPADAAADQDATELDKIKQRYWAQGSETEMGVVQNRLYTKSGKTEFWLFGAIVSSDPFLDTKSYGLSVGHHLNETLSIHAFGMQHSVNPSAALLTLESGNKNANTNKPKATVGAEAKASLLYGKLSLLGATILYYDMHAGLGAAVTWTETGRYAGPVASVGQSIYLNKHAALRFDYRMMAYREQLVEREITARIGESAGYRNNFSHTFQLGLSFMLGGDKP